MTGQDANLLLASLLEGCGPLLVDLVQHALQAAHLEPQRVGAWRAVRDGVIQHVPKRRESVCEK